LNGTKVAADNFQKYIALYRGMEAPVAYEASDRWQVAIGVSDGSFQQVSFVNSIATSKGGMHVNYIADQVTTKLVTSVKKKNKGSEVKASNIRNHIVVFVNALVVNPSFDSQTKDTLTTKISAFGSKCELSDKLLKAVEKSSVIENILTWAKFKQNAELKKKGGSKRSKLIGITKVHHDHYFLSIIRTYYSSSLPCLTLINTHHSPTNLVVG
jgi:DNA topoisomerase-2